jgi:DNA-binding transcriptional MerR regulator
MNERSASGKSADAYRTIGEVAEDLKLPQHVLRFWETRFPQIKPLKRAGGRRFYRPDDIALLRAIKAMLYGQGYTIKGVQRLLQDQGARSVAASATAPGLDGAPRPPGDRAAARVRDLEPEGSGPGDPVAEMPPPPPRTVPLPAVRQAPASLGPLLQRLDAVARDLAECRALLRAARAIDDRR